MTILLDDIPSRTTLLEDTALDHPLRPLSLLFGVATTSDCISIRVFDYAVEIGDWQVDVHAVFIAGSLRPTRNGWK